MTKKKKSGKESRDGKRANKKESGSEDNKNSGLIQKISSLKTNIKEETLDSSVSSLDYDVKHSTNTTHPANFNDAVISEKEEKIIQKQLNNLALNTHKAGMKGKLFELRKHIIK